MEWLTLPIGRFSTRRSAERATLPAESAAIEVKVFAVALNEGTEKAFYFILGDYVERSLQYGLVHQDLTPRPAYVAFAAVGRLLNAAEPIGRVDLGDEKLKGYVFRTQVDGAERETLVAWSETKENSFEAKTVQ